MIQALRLKMNQSDPPPLVAALTGDLIGSTQADAGAVDRAMAILTNAATDISAWHPNRDTRFTRYRGDGWQAIIEVPGEALRAALYIFARLSAARPGLSTRISIGIGTVTGLPSALLSDASGKAFEVSGRGLDQMGKLRKLAIDGHEVTPFHQIIARLLAERAGRWTPQQAEAMAFALHPDNPTQSDIANTLGISSQAVSYRLNGAGSFEIRDALRTWEDEYIKDAYISKGLIGDDRT